MKTLKNNIYIKALIINAICLFGLLLLFSPFFSADDNAMSHIIYGVYEDDYDCHATYMNFWYGRFLVILLRIMPNIPWYTVCFYLWIFLSLTIFSCLIFEAFDGITVNVLVAFIVLYFSYEGYIAIQFTKVAGITGTVGMLALIWPKKKYWYRVAGIFLFILSCMIRYAETRMIVGAVIFVLLCSFFVEILLKKQSMKQAFQQCNMLGVFAGIVIFLIVAKIPSSITVEEKEFWSLFWQYNEIRSCMQDYGIPDYQENKAIYDEMGISENDLYLIRSWNFDVETISLDKGKIILDLYAGRPVELGRDENGFVNLAEQNEMEILKQSVLESWNLKAYLNLKKIVSFFRYFPRQFLKIDLFWLYLLIIIIFPVLLDASISKKLSALGISMALFLALNYYMYVHDRYLQHRVDVGVLCIVMGIYLLLLSNEKIKKIANMEFQTLSICSLLVLSGVYLCGEDTRIVTKETLALNRIFYDESNKSIEKYILGARRSDGANLMWTYYDVWDVPQIGSAHNIVRSTRKQIETGKNEFGMAVDNLQSYFMLTDSDTNESAWLTYYREHATQNAELHLVKNYLQKKLFRVTTKDLTDLMQINQWENTSQIERDLSYAIVDGKLQISGSAYLEGESGFCQNCYVEIVDSQIDKKDMYFTLQTCDSEKKYGDDGYFAWITADIELPSYYDSSDTINLIIEQDGFYYSLKLDVIGKESY